MSKKQNPYERVNNAASRAIKLLIETCQNNDVLNPKIEFEASVSDGSKYILIFERIDLDKEVKP